MVKIVVSFANIYYCYCTSPFHTTFCPFSPHAEYLESTYSENEGPHLSTPSYKLNQVINTWIVSCTANTHFIPSTALKAQFYSRSLRENKSQNTTKQSRNVLGITGIVQHHVLKILHFKIVF